MLIVITSSIPGPQKEVPSMVGIVALEASLSAFTTFPVRLIWPPFVSPKLLSLAKVIVWFSIPTFLKENYYKTDGESTGVLGGGGEYCNISRDVKKRSIHETSLCGFGIARKSLWDA
jgi:hypothetical protein